MVLSESADESVLCTLRKTDTSSAEPLADQKAPLLNGSRKRKHASIESTRPSTKQIAVCSEVQTISEKHADVSDTGSIVIETEEKIEQLPTARYGTSKYITGTSNISPHISKGVVTGKRYAQEALALTQEPEAIDTGKTSDASADTDTDSSSELDTSSEDDSSNSSSAPSEHSIKRQPPVAPGQGRHLTAKRNMRRRRSTQLQRLKSAGILPDEADFRALERFQNGELPSFKPRLRPAWDFPSSPEPGWEKRLVVKQIECELDASEERVAPQQYLNGGSNKRFKGAADNDDHEVEITAAMYGDGECAALEDGEIENNDADDLPEPPADLSGIPNITENELRRGVVICFKHMSMYNYCPEISALLTAKVMSRTGESLTLQLSKRDTPEPLFDYEGERIFGPYDVHDDNGKIIEGRMKISRGDLIEPILLRAAP